MKPSTAKLSSTVLKDVPLSTTMPVFKNNNAYASVLEKQTVFFQTGTTLPIQFRIDTLKKLKKCILQHESEISDALTHDLGKPIFESYGAEIAGTISEIDYFIHNLRKLATDTTVSTPLLHFKASSRIQYQPYGKVLIIAPWNYPFLLSMNPLVGAVAAGNTCVLKPSEIAEKTALIIEKIINEIFIQDYVAVVQGGVNQTQELLENKFDLLFFTGSTPVGKIMYKAAAEHLTPVVLELGGKSPVIVDEDTDIEITARRIVWGKFLNTGQTCIAPDYVFVHENIKAKLIERCIHYIEDFYGKDAYVSSSYGRIITTKNTLRLKNYLATSNVIYGGKVNENACYVSPTLLDSPAMDSPVMQEEIFGPILPIHSYKNIDEVIQFIANRPKPLALYIFSNSKTFQNTILQKTYSGGVAINETVMHVANHNLPFGGVGASGIGNYHGKHSFFTFSHARSILSKSFIIDVKIRYAPYQKNRLGLLKFMTKYFM